jgi:DNA-binding Lrp family transcriptional regulator
MSLSCKVAHFNKVFEELLNMNIPNGDIFLLFGPKDILCQFECDTLEEFKKTWFNRVRIIGGEEGWITQTMTFIVINSGGETSEEPFAFVFLNTQPRNLEKVQKHLLEIPQILTADTVFGPHDIICSIRANNIKELEKIVSNIHEIVQGIEESMTTIIAGMRV